MVRDMTFVEVMFKAGIPLPATTYGQSILYVRSTCPRDLREGPDSSCRSEGLPSMWLPDGTSFFPGRAPLFPQHRQKRVAFLQSSANNTHADTQAQTRAVRKTSFTFAAVSPWSAIVPFAEFSSLAIACP
jgi:hypothetical protein